MLEIATLNRLPLVVVLAGVTAGAAHAQPAQVTAPWEPAPGGIANTGQGEVIRSLATIDGKLHVGGNFISAGGVTVNGITSWDGTQWVAFGEGLAEPSLSGNSVLAMIEFQGELVAGGNFSSTAGPTFTPVANLARFDASTQSWQPLGGGIGQGVDTIGIQLGNVRAMAIYDNKLIVAGEFNTVNALGNAQTVQNIAAWDGANWDDLGGGLVSINLFVEVVTSLAVYNGELYVGGFFDEAGFAGEPVVSFAKWDGSDWHDVGGGLFYNGFGFPSEGSGDALHVYNGDLYVAGFFDAVGPTPVPGGIAAWDGTDASSPGGGLLEDFANFTQSVDHLIEFNGSLVAAGGFVGTAPGTPDAQPANGLALWDGTSWTPFGSTAASTSFSQTPLAAIGSTLYTANTDADSNGAVEPVITVYQDVAPCPADLSGDGNLNNTDINLFVNAFLANDAPADFNGDGNFNNTDINLFVNAFLAGC